MTTLGQACLQYRFTNTEGAWCVLKTDGSRGPAARHRLSQVATLFIVAEAETSIVQGFLIVFTKKNKKLLIDKDQ